MDDLRCVRFTDSTSALQALDRYDEGFMNFGVGTLYDILRVQDATPEEAALEPALIFGLYSGDDLCLFLIRSPSHSTWHLVYPQDAEHLMSSHFFDVAGNILARALFAMAGPEIVTAVWGRREAIDAFLTVWLSLSSAQGVHLRLLDPTMVSRASYATRDTVAPLPTTFPSIDIAQATDSDFDELFPQWLDFTTYAAGTRALDVEEAHIRGTLASGMAWTCRSDGALAGFIVSGRATRRTITIRNVYVSPEHRRKGIAEAMVRAMSRHYLGVQPVGYGVSIDPPAVGVKEVVCINVIDPSAERIYRRAGFLFPEYEPDGSPFGGYDPMTGKKGWFHSALRKVQAEDLASSR
ncbi:hypothetical protein C8Q79DRAFT_1009495 [Trametes meyenii]|nr:hypothetical protein C8Q79DRAFT_1009495 [Trametes meyenii]